MRATERARAMVCSWVRGGGRRRGGCPAAAVGRGKNENIFSYIGRERERKKRKRKCTDIYERETKGLAI
jgi:hypothetical protein